MPSPAGRPGEAERPFAGSHQTVPDPRQPNELVNWNYDLELAGLQEMNFDQGLLGFSTDELSELLAPAANEALVDLDEVPEPPSNAAWRFLDKYEALFTFLV